MVMLEVIDSSFSTDEIVLGRCQVIPRVRHRSKDTQSAFKWYPLEINNALFHQRYVVIKLSIAFGALGVRYLLVLIYSMLMQLLSEISQRKSLALVKVKHL